MADQSQFFTDADIKTIISTQGEIKTAVAVATNNLTWIIENYKNQCKEIEGLKKDVKDLQDLYNNLKSEIWKYVGMGVGAATVIYLLIALFPIIKAVLAG